MSSNDLGSDANVKLSGWCVDMVMWWWIGLGLVLLVCVILFKSNLPPMGSKLLFQTFEALSKQKTKRGQTHQRWSAVITNTSNQLSWCQKQTVPPLCPISWSCVMGRVQCQRRLGFHCGRNSLTSVSASLLQKILTRTESGFISGSEQQSHFCELAAKIWQEQSQVSSLAQFQVHFFRTEVSLLSVRACCKDLTTTESGFISGSVPNACFFFRTAVSLLSVRACCKILTRTYSSFISVWVPKAIFFQTLVAQLVTVAFSMTCPRLVTTLTMTFRTVWDALLCQSWCRFALLLTLLLWRCCSHERAWVDESVSLTFPADLVKHAIF